VKRKVKEKLRQKNGSTYRERGRKIVRKKKTRREKKWLKERKGCGKTIKDMRLVKK
jgi:hypothetical protein